MGIDWSKYLEGLQGNVGGPRESFFPSSPWDNIASLMKAIAIPQANTLANKQQKMLSLIEEAKPFGLPGIRKLYADPSFIQLAKDIGHPLPNLPPPSSLETEETRRQAFFTETDAARTAQEQSLTGRAASEVSGPFAKVPGTEGDRTGIVHGPLSQQEQRHIYAAGARKYPEAAASLGIVTKLPPGQMSTILRGMLQPNMDPQTVLTAINLALAQSNQDPLDPELSQEITQLVAGPWAQARLEALRASTLQKIANADLSDTRRKEMMETLEKRMALVDAKIQLAQSQNDYRTVLTEIANIDKEIRPQIDSLKVQQAQANLTRTQAATALLKAHAELVPVQKAVYQARAAYMTSQYPSGLGGLKAQETAIRASMNASLKLIDSLRKVETTTPAEAEEVQRQIDAETERLEKDHKNLENVRERMDTLTEGGKPKPVGGKIEVDTNILSENGLKLFTHITTIVKDANGYQTAYNQLRANPGAKALSDQDWNAIWLVLRQQAANMGVDLPANPSEVKK